PTAPSAPARAPGGTSHRDPDLAALANCGSDAPSSAARHREAQDDDAAFLRTRPRLGSPAHSPGAAPPRCRRYPPADRGDGDRAAPSFAKEAAYLPPADTPSPC